jgi:trk system potassium uptake protein TrkA
VIVRASGEHQIRILESLGVIEILTPESEVASIVAEKLINPNITAFLQLPDDYEIAEIKAPLGITNRSLDDIDLRNKYSLTLITIKRQYEVKGDDDSTIVEEHIIGVPKSETVVYETDTLVVFGTLKHVNRFIEINEHKK